MPPRARLDQDLLRALEARGPLDDDQLGALLGTTRQAARGAALRLSETGVITRIKPPGGKWLSRLGNLPSPEALATTAAPPRSAPEHTLDPAAVSAAIGRLHAFVGAAPPRSRVAQLEGLIVGVDRSHLAAVLGREHIDDDVLRAALLVKQLAGEVNVIIHAVGILLALPYILGPSEKVLEASLGAGTGGRPYDLQTTHRIAEFKFTRWRGHDAVRQRELFADFVNLVEAADGDRHRQLFVAGATRPRLFLTTSRRKLSSVCERRPEVLTRITQRHGNVFQTVAEYTAACGDRVEIVDLETILPAYVGEQFEEADIAEAGADEELP